MNFYNPVAFRVEQTEELLSFIEKNPLATLITSVNGDTLVSHLPMVSRREEGQILLTSHFSKSNPHLEACHRVEQVYLVFHGVSTEITPILYGEVGVPTWNYEVVHAKGRLRFLEGEKFEAALEDMTRHFEDKRGSSFSSYSTDPYVLSMKRGIEVFEVVVTEIEGKFKLSQNRPLEDRVAVAKFLEKSEDAQDRLTAIEMVRVNKIENLS